MSDPQNSAFGKFVPGFDFLQSLAKGASQNIPQMPSLGNWVAPTINVEELDKRIDELKAVQFWLDQNATALKATIQALEVQKMTLATLKGMNFNLGDVANAFKLKAADTVMGGVQKAGEKAAEAAADAAETLSGAVAGASAARTKRKTNQAAADAANQAGVVDPMQWWGSLTQQFQQIAASAMKDAAKQTAMDTTKNVAAGLAKGAFNTAAGFAKAASTATTAAARSATGGARRASTAKKAAKKTSSRKPAPRAR